MSPGEAVFVQLPEQVQIWQVETRRFEAREPADGTASTVGPALNTAANRVAGDVAQWIGG